MTEVRILIVGVLQILVYFCGWMHYEGYDIAMCISNTALQLMVPIQSINFFVGFSHVFDSMTMKLSKLTRMVAWLILLMTYYCYL